MHCWGWPQSCGLWLWEETSWRSFLIWAHSPAWRLWTCRTTHCVVTALCFLCAGRCKIYLGLQLEWTDSFTDSVSLYLWLRWMENVSLELTATCGHPPELRGQKVRGIHVFKSCPENISPPEKKSAAYSKVKKSKADSLKSRKVKAQTTAKVAKLPRKQPQRKPGPPKVTKKKKILKWEHVTHFPFPLFLQ